MLKLFANLALPALGIVIAALAQLGVTTLWPGMQLIPSGVVSIDSYFVVLLTFGLCFFAGRWAHTNVPTVTGAAFAAVIPLIWLVMTLRGNFTAPGHIAWFRPLTVFVMFVAVVPLIGVGFGWGLSSSKHQWTV
jgi:hypothetical protein